MPSHFHHIRRAALSHHTQVVRRFHGAHRHARRLLKKHRIVIHKVRDHSVRTAVVASVSSGLIATPALMATAQTAKAESNASAQGALTTNPQFAQTAGPFKSLPPLGPSTEKVDKTVQFRERLNTVAPGESKSLTVEQEAAVTQVIQETFGLTARAELEGVRLNVVRGKIAGEQHLPLYPGDTIHNHFKNRITGQVSDPTANLTGMVPGLPSWGYFAKNAKSVTKQDVEREQWYIAAQTFLAPGWRENTNKMYNFFKYRKMIIINPETGQAVVVDIGDAGPSPSTGRSFGGSNEVLIGLGLGKKRTGTVMTLFVDDPGDTIPLGPLTGYSL